MKIEINLDDLPHGDCVLSDTYADCCHITGTRCWGDDGCKPPKDCPLYKGPVVVKAKETKDVGGEA